MMEHSKAPWDGPLYGDTGPKVELWIRDAHGRCVARVMGVSPGDATLVRSAPELLETARGLRDALRVVVKAANHRGANLIDADQFPSGKRLAEIEVRFGIAP